MNSVRLYHEDAYQRRFDAEVVGHTSHAGKPALVLDRTAFYPEAGGQLGDRGQLTAAGDVVDTQETDAGEILHVLEAGAELPAVGARISGEIAWPRRRQHMASHTAQHLLSGALLERAQAETVSARLGESALTIDVRRDRIPEAEIAAAEALANDLIDDDLAVRAWFPEAGELAGLALRRAPKVTENIRVVAIGEFDVSPCGGTHVARTAQLGIVRVTSVERYKGLTRVSFVAGRHAREEMFARELMLRGVAGGFSCGLSEVASAVERLRKDVDAGTAEVSRMRGRLAEALAGELTREPGAVVAEVDGDVELMRAVAAKLVAAGRDAVLCCPIAEGTGVVIMRSAGSSLDSALLWKSLAAKFGGRGGGRADRAEGKLNTRVGDWAAAVAGTQSA